MRLPSLKIRLPTPCFKLLIFIENIERQARPHFPDTAAST
jgi:hypothetical protein